MKTNCNPQNPLLRDGTSQQQRLLNALLPSYVSVDERSMDDLIKFASDFSAEIKYYSGKNTTDGNWSDFFANQNIDTDSQRTQPHYALFLAFLQMFKVLQNDLNTITQRHLEYYYKDVLRLHEREAIPDQVFVIFGLAKSAATAIVPRNTDLDGGSDAAGVKRTYTTSKDLVVNKAAVKELKACFYNKSNDHRIYASPVANSADGKGLEIEDLEKKWRTFGAIKNPAANYAAALVDRNAANIGFAFSSPVLLMSEGKRQVTVSLSLDSTENIIEAELRDAFNIYFSGSEEWITADDGGGYIILEGNVINIIRTLKSGQPAVVPYSIKLKDQIETQYPVVKVLLNPDAPSYVYNKLKGLSLRKADIRVYVTGVKNLVIQNDASGLDAARPFLPFGSKPVIGSNFYIGSNEVFSKKLSSVTININWKGLPTDYGGFESYYHNYISSGNARKSENFKVNISILDGRVWYPLLDEESEGARLFDAYLPEKMDSDAYFENTNGTEFVKRLKTVKPGLIPFRKIAVVGGGLGNVSWDYANAIKESDDYSTTTRRGFIRLKLAGVDFGHGDFQTSFTAQAIKAAAAKTSTSIDKGTSYVDGDNITQSEVRGTKSEEANALEIGKLPNPPYTPEIAELTLNYEAGTSLDLNSADIKTETNFSKRLNQFFHVEPFGSAERHPYLQNQLKMSANISLLPIYEDEGSLYIGLENAEPGEVVSLLFKSADGTSNPELLKQPLKWSYLSRNQWLPFPSYGVISDSTNGLLSSGIVELDIPKNADNNNSIFPKGMHWIRLSIFKDSFSACQLIDVRAQAALATFTDNNNDPAHLQNGLTAKSIEGFVNSLSGVKDLVQPYASFGGKMKESNLQFYTRVSERLRHKNRAVTIWDYERLVLEKFSEIYKAKCVNHAAILSPSNYNLVSPGHVSMLVISNVRNKNAVNPLQPTTSLLVLDEIKAFLHAQASPAVKIYVSNPIYEEIQVSFNVKFMPGCDSGFYSKQLNEEIKTFLAPWAYTVKDISFGGAIHRSVILNFVEEREYVDYVTVFQMDQIVDGVKIPDIEEAVASSPASILTSSAFHTITVIDGEAEVPADKNLVNKAFAPVDDACECNSSDSTAGINYFTINVNFVVGGSIPGGNEGLGLLEIDENFTIE